MAHDLSKMMRLQLAGHGIPLDEPRMAARRAAAPQRPTIDRQAIRDLLAPKVPARSLDWLTASCPSVQDAIEFQMPRLR